MMEALDPSSVFVAIGVMVGNLVTAGLVAGFAWIRKRGGF